MAQDCWLWSQERILPSDFEVVPGLVEEIAVQLEVLGWGAQDSFGVQMALEEALTNAIRHGNRMDTSKAVRLACHADDRQVEIEIADEGPGFRPEEVPDATAPENLEKPSGRGILLMRAYMDQVEHAGAGNIVVMRKQRLSGAAADA
jgi:serine/threonine-protein kinase RsbW